MPKKKAETTEEKLNRIIELLEIAVALEYSRAGVPQVDIGTRLHLQTSTVGAMLKGVKKEKR